MLDLGLKGENAIRYELKNSNIGMYVLHDINICYKDLKAQIDYIIIRPIIPITVQIQTTVINYQVRQVLYSK